jgi:hypothetical protein
MQLFAVEDPEDRVAKLVELNVKEQVLNVMKSACRYLIMHCLTPWVQLDAPCTCTHTL